MAGRYPVNGTNSPNSGEKTKEEKMNVAKATFFAFLIALVAVGVSTTAYSFHSGGVAECEGCHSMHSPATSNNRLLIGTDPSSTCLSCHESSKDTGPNGYHISTAAAALATGPPMQRTPGGDFGWVKKTWSASADPQDKHGHNIVAADKLYNVDATNVYAPGSDNSFLSSQLGCQSCHDQHGQTRRTLTGYQRGGTLGATVLPIMASGSYNTSPDPTATEAVGIYRLLRGVGDNTQGPTFVGAPIAVAPGTYNQTEAEYQVRVAYGASGINTWGNWCATCHADMHSTGNYVHKVDGTLGDKAAIYNAYKKSGDLSGTSANAFSSLVPFAEATGLYTTLKTHADNAGLVMAGPATGDQVMCLSCHRAHASGMPEALRFSQSYEFMTYAGDYIGMDNPAMTSTRKATQTFSRNSSDWKAAYYDRPKEQFATYQRVLCNKCHAKD
jgi:predicted CXXCH cytochrome family protein